ncbi:MAG: hypothetical protein P8163_22050 [Candidatus Thiodiazotropha sp.]
MIAMNALVAGLAAYSIANEAEWQNEIEEIVRNVEKTRLPDADEEDFERFLDAGRSAVAADNRY